jgi:hypothetical protein
VAIWKPHRNELRAGLTDIVLDSLICSSTHHRAIANIKGLLSNLKDLTALATQSKTGGLAKQARG